MNYSVLMPVYYKETASNLDASMKSILKDQTVKPAEFVLVCDGPLTDGLEEVVARYCEEFPDVMNVVRLEKNSGLGIALGIGLEHCRYEIVARADSDDICVPERFEKQLKFLEECGDDVAVIGSDIDEFDTDPASPVHVKRMPSDFSDVVKMSKFRNPLNHMTVMFRKTCVIDAGSYVHLQYVEDYYLWVRLLAKGYRITNINEVLVHARIGNGMVGRRGHKQYIPSWKTLNRYKLSHGQINRFEYVSNMMMIRFFIYMPEGLKKISYKRILRSR